MKNIGIVLATVAACGTIFIAGAIWGARNIEIEHSIETVCVSNCVGV